MADNERQNGLFEGDEPAETETNLNPDDAGECEPLEGCEEDPEATGKAAGKGKKTKGNQAKAASSTPAKPAAPPAAHGSRYTYPFFVRYAAEILDLTGFVDGHEYIDAQIKELLIQNGYTEFADVEPAFHRSEATNTLVITIKGSKKGRGHGR